LSLPPFDLPFIEAMLASHARALAEPLVPAELTLAQAAAWLYGEASFALLAHDSAEDPRFVYANLQAQRCFERSWDELIGMPSRLSAEAPNRAERAAMLAGVARDGFIRDYRGIRIAKSGSRFWIEGGIVWNVYAASGELWGQAACFREVTPA
jgi:hypothetical protein